MKITERYRRRLHAAGGVEAAYERLKCGETVGQIADSLVVSRPFLSRELNRNPARMAEIRGGKDRGGTGKLTPEQLNARIQRQMQSVSKLDEMIAERLAWIENLKRHRAEKLAAVDLWRVQLSKGAPMRPKREEMARFKAALEAKFADPTPEDVTEPPEPMWEAPESAAEPESVAPAEPDLEPEGVPEPVAAPEEFRLSFRRWDRPDEPMRVIVKPAPESDFAPKLSATRLEKVKPARVPKARQIQVIRLDR